MFPLYRGETGKDYQLDMRNDLSSIYSLLYIFIFIWIRLGFPKMSTGGSPVIQDLGGYTTGEVITHITITRYAKQGGQVVYQGIQNLHGLRKWFGSNLIVTFYAYHNQPSCRELNNIRETPFVYVGVLTVAPGYTGQQKFWDFHPVQPMSGIALTVPSLISSMANFRYVMSSPSFHLFKEFIPHLDISQIEQPIEFINPPPLQCYALPSR